MNGSRRIAVSCRKIDSRNAYSKTLTLPKGIGNGIRNPLYFQLIQILTDCQEVFLAKGITSSRARQMGADLVRMLRNMVEIDEKKRDFSCTRKKERPRWEITTNKASKIHLEDLLALFSLRLLVRMHACFNLPQPPPEATVRSKTYLPWLKRMKAREKISGAIKHLI